MKDINIIDFSKIMFVLMDMDGVLSDGSLIYLPDGGIVKVFHAHDGYGIERGRQKGLRFGVISGKTAIANKYRVERLKIEEFYESQGDKVAAFMEIKAKYNLKDDNFCFIGDDVFDIPLLNRVAFSCAPSNAVKEVKESVHYVTETAGGKGAVREVIDYILRKKGLI
jgi:3-deoxy-D-manno-octulosonate 8-phosphate phosphatase (KDO 8-P phosphatase)